MVCDLFVFLNIKNNPKVSCVFHAARPSSGFSLGFGGWGLLWGLWRRDQVINDGIGKVCRWDSYAETAAFSTCLFYCLTKHGDRYVRFVGICFGGLLGFLVCVFFISLYHSFLLVPFSWHIQGFALHCSPVTRFMLCLSAEMLFEPKPYVI